MRVSYDKNPIILHTLLLQEALEANRDERKYSFIRRDQTEVALPQRKITRDNVTRLYNLDK